MSAPSVYTERMVKANNRHTCCECYHHIEKGDQYVVVSGCWDYDWHTYKTCTRCNKIRDVYSNLPDVDREEVYFEHLKEHILEVKNRDETICELAARINVPALYLEQLLKDR